jgi:hypothetical protein
MKKSLLTVTFCLVPLAGCATIPATDPATAAPAVRLSVARSATMLRALVSDLADPAGPRSADDAVAAIDEARASVAAAALVTGPGISGRAQLAGLGVLLSVCREGARSAVHRAARAPGEAPDASRALAIGCLGPLAAVGY